MISVTEIIMSFGVDRDTALDIAARLEKDSKTIKGDQFVSRIKSRLSGPILSTQDIDKATQMVADEF